MIEFGNRTLTFVVGVLAIACVIAAVLRRPARRELTVLAVAVFAGIPAQAVVGGITVRTGLNPWVVGLHFLVSMAVIGLGYLLWVRSDRRPGNRPGRPGTPADPAAAALRPLAWLIVAVSAAVLVIGTVVTGSGPHAGDADAPRTGLDPGQVAQLHADLVFGLLGLSVALWLALRAAGAGRAARRAAAVLVAVELGQGVIGFVQYFTNLPALAVGLHMFGACLVWVATLAVLVASGVPAPTGVDPRPAVPAGGLPPALIPGSGTPGPAATGTGSTPHSPLPESLVRSQR